MAASSKRPSAEENGLSLVCGLAGQGCVRGAEPCPADDRSRTQRSGCLVGACIIDSQSVKTSEAGGRRGHDAGKKIIGRKRHALVDTDGRGLVLFAHPASVQDRDAAGPLLAASRRPFPFIEKVFADAG